MRKFWENSYLTQNEAKLLEIEKEKNKTKLYFENTIFYAEKGGQLSDTGEINSIEVIDVKEDENGKIWHYVEKDYEWKIGETYLQKINWERRFNFMQQHTAQHLITRIIYKLFKRKTISSSISLDYTTIDLEGDKFTDKMIEQVEYLVNDFIYKNYPINIKFINKEDIAKYDIINPSKAADKIEDEFLRLVEIGNLDSNFCGGTHVNSLGEIGLIKIIKQEKIKNDTTRIYFTAGKKALELFISYYSLFQNIGKKLSCGIQDFEERINNLLEENKNLNTNIKNLQKDFIQLYKDKIVEKAEITENFVFIMEIFENYDIKFARSLFNEILKDTEKQYFITFFCINKEKKTVDFIIGKSKTIDTIDIKDILENLNKLLNARGGGSEFQAQGSGVYINSLENIFKFLRDKIIG